MGGTCRDAGGLAFANCSTLPRPASSSPRPSGLTSMSPAANFSCSADLFPSVLPPGSAAQFAGADSHDRMDPRSIWLTFSR
jgi:hypothetical protein